MNQQQRIEAFVAELQKALYTALYTWDNNRYPYNDGKVEGLKQALEIAYTNGILLTPDAGQSTEKKWWE